MILLVIVLVLASVWVALRLWDLGARIDAHTDWLGRVSSQATACHAVEDMHRRLLMQLVAELYDNDQLSEESIDSYLSTLESIKRRSYGGHSFSRF